MNNNYAQSWKNKYDVNDTDINFVSGDFDSLKEVIRQYVVANNPENYNDWSDSSEIGMMVNGLSYLGESLHYRVDLNAHDNFPSTTERRESLLNFTKMLSYSPKRNICANGLAKLSSISTTQSVVDVLGNNLKDVTVLWNDAANQNWLEQFLTILNSAFIFNNSFGKPLKKTNVDAIMTQLYQLNSTTISSATIPFLSTINSTQYQFEVVNPDIDLTNNVIFERQPISEQAFHLLYRNEGTGNTSPNTGFFVYWKQGSLNNSLHKFNEKIENNSIEITSENINEFDVWLSEVDSTTGLTKNNWTKISSDEYLVYNNTSNTIRDIFKVETRDNDTITVRFSDGNFGTIPVGIFKLWYRVSDGNSNIYIKPADIKNVSVKIPYKSNNVIDDTTYYLTLTFSVEDVSHIEQATPQESVEYIRQRAPEIYSTQNRMVTGSDYNIFPLSQGQQLKICNSIVRTYAGNSRYINFNDPTGTYQDLSILAEDGYLYKTDRLYTKEDTVDTSLTPREVIMKNITPLLSSVDINNFFYDKYPTHIIRYESQYSAHRLIWRELYNESNNKSVGQFLDIDNVVIKSNIIQKLFKVGNLVKLISEDTQEEKWISIQSIEIDPDDSSVYTITINESLSLDKKWETDVAYNTFTNALTPSIFAEMEAKIENTTSFGLTFNDNTTEWEIIDGSLLTNDDEDFDYNMPYNSDGNFKNWIIKVTYESNGFWLFTIRYVDYIFGSENEVSFFFNTTEKLNDINFFTRDYIKVLKINETNGQQLKEDYYWKPCESIVYSDGYVEPMEIIVYGYDSDKDSVTDVPTQFHEIVNNGQEKLYFMKSDTGYNSFIKNVITIPSLWEHTTISGNYFCEESGTIYPRGTKLPQDIKLTKSVRLSNGVMLYASPTNPHLFSKGTRLDYDVVDDGWIVDFQWLSDIDSTVPDHEDELITFEKTSVESELLTWNATDDIMVRYSEEQYIIREGISNLKFIWKKYSSSDHLTDPCPTNIIDIFALTTQYYNDVQNWLSNNKRDSFPKLPTSSELSSMFEGLKEYKMVSDTIVWHPVKYKLLFGAEATNTLRANFKVIKGQTTMSDNEIKQNVIKFIDEYFATLEAGQTYYFTNLSAYIKSQMGSNIDTIVPVPSHSDEKFGNLFEIACENDEILLSSATVDNVQIITKITDYNIRMA